MNHFQASRLKVKRANKHIRDLNAFIRRFSRKDFYAINVHKDPTGRHNMLQLVITESLSPDAALVLGDAFHNLKSALDILWNEIVYLITNAMQKNARFPFRETRKELEGTINGAFKEKVVDHVSFLKVRDFVLDGVQPYKTGNAALWAVYELNILDKHKLLIPVPQLFALRGICLEDKEKGIEERFAYFLDSTGTVRVDMPGNLTVKDKGHASATVFFDVGLPFEGKPVIPTLHQLAKVVSDVIDSFEAVLF